MVFCPLIASSAIRAFISALKLRRCLDFILAPFPRQRFYTLLSGPNFGEHLKVRLRSIGCHRVYRRWIHRATRESYLTRFPFLVNHAKGERKFQFPDSE